MGESLFSWLPTGIQEGGIKREFGQDLQDSQDGEFIRATQVIHRTSGCFGFGCSFAYLAMFVVKTTLSFAKAW